MKVRYISIILLPSIFLLYTFNSRNTESAVKDHTGTLPLLGFTLENSKNELQLEKKFDSYLSATSIRKRLKIMSSKPNQVGSPHDKWNAEYQDSLFKSWGWDSQIEKFKVLYPTPKEQVLEMTRPYKYKAGLTEPPIKGDPSTFITKNVLPGYNAYGGDGDVTAELVYVNQGLPDDYKELKKRGISVRGKIVIVRYGGAFRGVKPKLAQKHGAVGCIIYSDPSHRDDPHPKGSGQPFSGIQRGSVLDIMVRPGDPLTPGIGADANAHRIPRDSAKTIMKIPVLPISAKAAKPFLSELEGPLAPDSWQGGYPFAYHIGSGSVKVHLKVINNWNMKTIYDVIAKIKGSIYPDQWIIRGNHRDGWVFGAADPLSSNVDMSEGAKAIGKLLQQGWRPKRTIVYCSWDGEEPGIIGSTEWVEQHADELKHKAVIYINSDGNGRGFLHAGGSHSLQRFINEVGRSVIDPETGVNVIKRLRARRMVQGNQRAATAKDLVISAIGSGSDFGPFLDHLGIPSLSLGFGGEGGGGAYHSAYDTFTHYLHVSDSTFEYGVALSKVAGHAVLRMANADILPFHFSDMAKQIKIYISQVEKEVVSIRKERKSQQKLYTINAYKLASDPTKTYNPPEVIPPVPHVNFDLLKKAITHLSRAAATYDSSFSTQVQQRFKLSKEKIALLNHQLQSISQALNAPHGLFGRPWYRNLIYATGLYSGYGVETLPEVRGAVQQHKWKEANRGISITAKAINRYANRIEQATQQML